MRILHFDLETAPSLVYTWSLFKPMIGHNQIVESSRVICASYQWHDEDKVRFVSEHHDGRKEMLNTLWNLIDEADIVCGYNIAGFDNGWLSSEFIAEGFPPPSPVQVIDLYQIIKRHTKFPSKKLAYVAPRLLSDSKVTHAGFDMWTGCMAGDEKSWRMMKKYAVKDTELLKPLYMMLRPWMKNHPNIALDAHDDQVRCPTCSSTDIQRRGYSYTNASRFQRYRCNECGKWSKYRTRVSSNELRNA